MGKKLANEVTTFVNKIAKVEMITKISFIGHSMGGIIIRSALTNLPQY